MQNANEQGSPRQRRGVHASAWAWRRLASGCVAALIAGSTWAGAQVILRQPTQILDDEFALHQARVGSVVALDGDALLVANQSGRPFSAGYLLSYAQGVNGYEFIERVSPQACFSGPSSPPVTNSGITACLFPWSLQVVDDIAVASSYGGDFLGGSPAFGLVHVLRRSQNRWIVDQYLRGFADPSNTATGFGISVKFDGTTIAVRMAGYDEPGVTLQGAVAMYERNPTGLFERVAILRPSPNAGGPPPGSTSMWLTATSIALDDGVLVMSERHHFAQRVRVYERGVNGWSETQVIERPPNASTSFGYHLALDAGAGVMAVSAQQGEGRVFVYERDPATRLWNLTSDFGPAEGSSLPGYAAYFGWSMRVRGDMIAVGAPWGDMQGQPTGTVEVFRRGPQGWARERRVAPPIAGLFVYQQFGYALDLADGRLLVGAEWYTPDPTRTTGRAYLYQLTEGTLACEGPGNTVDLHALFDDNRDGRMQLSAFGLTGGGLGYFVAGTPTAATPLGGSDLCVGAPRRISGPLAFAPSTDRVYAHVQHPDPSSPLGTAFQFVYRQTGTGNTGASVARIVD